MKFSITNFFRTLLAFLVGGLLTIASVFGGGAPRDESLPETPDGFTPVLRFAVCSDIHINGDPDQAEAQRYAKLYDFLYDWCGTQSYTNLDAVCVAGDFTNQGSIEQYKLFNEISNEKLRDGTQLLVCIGNHEFIDYRGTDASVGLTVFEEQIGHSTDTSVKINGYHFILAGYCEDGKSFTGKLPWLRGELDAAVADTGDKPVFVFHHPAPMGTCYGSVNWGDPSLPTVLINYPQVVDFSGHSHYPVNDPRSIWQGGFTALGDGTLSYFETELDCIAGNFPYEVGQAAQFYIVEADAEGNVRILSYDLITDSFFDNEYYLTDLAEKNYDYSYAKLKSLDKAPVFPEDTEISVSLNNEGETVLYFTGAEDDFVVESYKVNVTDGVFTVAEDNFSGKYMYLGEKEEFTVNLGKLDKGVKYNVSIVALNAYAKGSSPLTYTFTGL